MSDYKLLQNSVIYNPAWSTRILLYLGLFIYDNAGSFWDREGEKWSLCGSQDEVSVSLDHRVQVLPLWLGAVVHRYLI